jgi:hypothetical protein
MLIAEELEEEQDLFRPTWERFRGYGVLGLPFASGHLLAFQRMTASSVGPPSTSIWHRDPSGCWTMLVDTTPDRSCPRFFGAAMDRVVVEDIDLSWDGPRRLSLRAPEHGLQWGIRLTSDFVTRTLSWMGSLVPGAAWRNQRVHSLVGRVGGKALGVGKLSLSGRVPNGQRFLAVPRMVFGIEATAAVVQGKDLGSMGPLQEQARLGDFWIPNGGLFAIGGAAIESLD